MLHYTKLYAKGKHFSLSGQSISYGEKEVLQMAVNFVM
jgi:hypothetical protein